MKFLKSICVLSALAVSLSVTACGRGSEDIVIVPRDTTVLPVPSYTTAAEAAPEAAVFRNGTDGIDIDITVLSSTMVYSTVYCMVYDPLSYIGMTVKMNGSFSYVHDDYTGNDYFACVIQDATACCSQGIEFILADADERTYPDDYPSLGDEITVTGVFDTYSENGFTYCVLRDAELS